MNYETIKLSNQNRIKALNSQKNIMNIYNVPRSAHMKTTESQIRKLKREFGYDLDLTNSQSQHVKWCCQQFENKLVEYNKHKRRWNKMGRMDKIRAKEQIGFVIKKNPFTVKLQKMCAILNRNFTQPGFDLICLQK